MLPTGPSVLRQRIRLRLSSTMLASTSIRDRFGIRPLCVGKKRSSTAGSVSSADPEHSIDSVSSSGTDSSKTQDMLPEFDGEPSACVSGALVSADEAVTDYIFASESGPFDLSV